MSSVIQAHRERVGRQIRRARKQAGFSHDALALRVGSSRQHLIKLEKGMHLPGEALLARIGEATGKPPGFFEDEDDEEAASMGSHHAMLAALAVALAPFHPGADNPRAFNAAPVSATAADEAVA